MRLTAKMTAFLMLVIVWLVAAQAWHTTERMSEQHLAEMRDDLCSVAGTLGTAADVLWHEAGRERVNAYLVREGGRLPWLDIDSPSWRPDMNIISVEEFAALPRAVRRDYIETTDDALLIRLQFGESNTPMVLEFRHSLAAHDRYVDELIERQLLFGGVLVFVGGTALFMLGILFVGRPVRQLVEQARRIAGGDFSMRANIGQRDEIGALAREMNRMSERLEAAHLQVRKERHARAAALAQLRHADRLSTVGKLASSIAHELGTPLNVVSGRAQLILADAHCPPEIADDVRIIDEQAAVMTRIIRQPLDFVHRSSGQKRQAVELAGMLNHARVLLEPLAEERDIVIEISHAPGVQANIDEDQALQLITNLMVNAIQAMPDGGTLRLTADEEQFDTPPAPYATPGRYARITVQDQGVGIPEDQLERIFEPFFTTKEHGQGTGLGLSVCDGIARDHGGWISVQSKRGEGSTFTVHVPAP